jgi:hypothetical protein
MNVRRRPIRIAAGWGVALALAALVVTPAQAHQPVFLTASNRTPSRGPLLLDGTVSFAIYGSLPERGQERWVRARFKKGDVLNVELLLPNKRPESGQSSAEVPVAVIRDPKGQEILVAPDKERSTFDEPFSKTSYVHIASFRGTAEAGEYAVGVRSNTAGRFTLVVGNRETRGVVRGASRGSLTKWWSTP